MKVNMEEEGVLSHGKITVLGFLVMRCLDDEVEESVTNGAFNEAEMNKYREPDVRLIINGKEYNTIDFLKEVDEAFNKEVETRAKELIDERLDSDMLGSLREIEVLIERMDSKLQDLISSDCG